MNTLRAHHSAERTAEAQDRPTAVAKPPDVSINRARGGSPEAPTARQGESEGGSGTPLPLIWASDAKLLLDAPYVVKNVIGPGELVVIYGAPKSGKTFFAVDMALHVAAGLPWFGHRVRPGLVLYVASEMGGRAERRVKAWLDYRMGDAAAAPPFAVVPKVVNLLDEMDVERLVVTIESLLATYGRPALLVVDTLARSMVGGDENSAKDMGRAIAVADRLRDTFNTATALVHHAGKDIAKGSRGSSALLGGADSYILVDADQAGAHVATVEWSRDGESGERIGFRLRQIDLGIDAEGDKITTCVVEPALAPSRAAGRDMPRGAKTVLTAIQIATMQHGQHGSELPMDADAPHDVRVVALGHARNEHARKYGERDQDAQRGARARQQAFNRGLDELQRRGLIGISGPWVWQTPAG